MPATPPPPPGGSTPPPASPPKASPAPLPPTARPAPDTGKRTVKTFSVKTFDADAEGEKLIIYGPSGIGKSTLAASCPGAVFISADDGARRILQPQTGAKLPQVPGVECWEDLRDALQQKDLFPANSTIVIDTITKLEEWIQDYCVRTVKVKSKAVDSFRKFGWDGADLIVEQFRLLMSDLDRHVRNGTNVILLAQQGQIKRSAADSADYLEDGPFVTHTNRASAREELKQWADHVFRIGYADFDVHKADGERAGKVTQTDTTRVIFANGSLSFTAKARRLKDGFKLPEVISFAEEGDASLWAFMFGGYRPEAA